MGYYDPIRCNKAFNEQPRFLNILPAQTLPYLLFILPGGIILAQFLPIFPVLIVCVAVYIGLWILMGGDPKSNWRFNARNTSIIVLVKGSKQYEPIFEDEIEEEEEN